ncbi:MAG: BRCA1-associated -like [Trebouxia sp. A1-2]|nr:MAG: BRCA1-associated -like [Trebouxia sp. A1-2]
MYAVKVNVKQSTEDADLSEEASRLATALLAEQVLEATGSSDHIQDAVSFSAGNPRVEHLTGKVHLYRQISDPEQAQQRKQLPADRSERLCVLAMPLDMGVAEFCSFVGGYLPKLREMRVVRREDGKSVCLILLRFENLEIADSFFHDYHDKPVCNHRFHNECLQRWGDLKCPVWDYASDGYVHRLVQSKTDGKLVEVPSPAQAAFGERHSTDCPEGPRSSAEDAALGEAMVASKREEMDREIDHLLIMQSENLRRYWEGRVSDAHLRGEAACSQLQDQLDLSGAALQTAAANHKELEKQKRAVDKKLAEIAVKVSKLQKEKDFLQQTSESLLRNQDDFRTQLAAEQAKVRDLMVYLEAQQQVQASGEMAQGTVLPVPEPAPAPKRKGNKGQGR